MPDIADRLERYRRMLRIRRFEERIAELYRDGVVPGFVHLSVGQEAVAVGATWALGPEDWITSTHRGHGHVLAKGMDLYRAFAELMGRDDGACRGRGGSMHLADPGLGILGANGIVGAGLPIAAGAALASELRGRQRVVVAFFGDGAIAQGAFHEAANLAALWRLPLILCCENNHWAEFSRTADQHPAPLSARAAAYGLPYHHVDGNDVDAVTALLGELTHKIRTGAGPVFVEAETLRGRGHYEGDPQKYRRLRFALPSRLSLLTEGNTGARSPSPGTQSQRPARRCSRRAPISGRWRPRSRRRSPTPRDGPRPPLRPTRRPSRTTWWPSVPLSRSRHQCPRTPSRCVRRG